VYDKYNYQLLQQLQTGNNNSWPDGVYWDYDTGALWVALDALNQVLKFTQTRQIWNPSPFNPTPLVINLTTSVSPSTGPDVGTFVAQFHQIYQPIDNVINVIDVFTNKVKAVWSVSPTFTGTLKGISYDPLHRNLVVGSNAGRVFIVSAVNGAVVANITVPGSIDQTVVVPYARRAYAGDKAGFVDVLDLDNYVKVISIPSASAAHTLTAFQTSSNQIKVFSYFDQTNVVGVFTETRS